MRLYLVIKSTSYFFALLLIPLLAYAQEPAVGGIKGLAQSFKSSGGYLDLGFRTGYMFGQNTYEFDHHRSELEFPFRSYMGGGTISLGYKGLSINSEVWGTIVDDSSAGYHMKDKDWLANELESDTKSNSSMNGVIWDANMRYDFLNYAFGGKKAEDNSKTSKIKLGALIGYRYERFGWKAFGLYQTCGTDTGYSDQTVIEYKVKYRLPYCGLAVDIENSKFGIKANGKYSFKPHAMDLDNHVLHQRTNLGDYKSNPNVFMGNFSAFWKFSKNWNVNIGADVTLIRINGRTWEENHDPDWDADQNIDTKQFIYWMGLGYRF